MSIESNRDTKFRMDEMMAVHQFEVDYEGDMDGAMQDAILRELQRQVNKYSSRYPLLLRDGRPPVVYDLSKASNFLVVEVVLYSEDHKDKIEARRRARVIRQQKVADTYDPDF